MIERLAHAPNVTAACLGLDVDQLFEFEEVAAEDVFILILSDIFCCHCIGVIEELTLPIVVILSLNLL